MSYILKKLYAVESLCKGWVT